MGIPMNQGESMTAKRLQYELAKVVNEVTDKMGADFFEEPPEPQKEEK
jgi:hypothetical protein